MNPIIWWDQAESAHSWCGGPCLDNKEEQRMARLQMLKGKMGVNGLLWEWQLVKYNLLLTDPDAGEALEQAEQV